MDTKSIIMAGVAAVIFAVCLVGWIFAKRKLKEDTSPKPKKLKSRIWFMGMLIGGWFLTGVFITQFLGKKSTGLAVEFEMFSESVNIAEKLPFLKSIPFLSDFALQETTLIALAVSVILIILMVIFRIVCVPKFSVDRPSSIQNAFEALIEMVDSFVKKSVGEMAAKQLSPYMCALGLFIIGCAATELLGLRAPTSDLTCTFAMGLITFALLNIYGIKKGGIGGRLKNMGGAVPAMRPVMIPLKAVSDIAVPVSLACRLFGNMLGGMMVMDLLKGVLGGYGSGIPAIAGLYFNLFHPMIQMYIFITLSLTFINEAME